MGPILIFDKSTLESLNYYEAMWLDTFFLTNFTPLFLVETLADLEKEVRKGRTPEEVVGGIASKSPENGRANAHHRLLLEGELSGEAHLDLLSGRPHITGGRRVELEGRSGIIFQTSAEEAALARWRRGEFLDLERQQAKAWRVGLSGIDFESQYKWFQRFFPMGRPRTLADVKTLVDFHVRGFDQEAVLRFALGLEGVTPKFMDEILARWRAAGKPPIADFAPYLAHLLSVDLFFYLGIAADLIGRHRPSHKIDLAYLYYLPFCSVFSSNDKLHLELAPYFLRPDQSLVPGTQLKADLAALENHYDSLPDEVKERGVINFASSPPHDDRFLVTRLWDKHMARIWRRPSESVPPPDSAAAREIVATMTKMIKEGKPIGDHAGDAEPDSMIIERIVRPRRGKWKMFPPEVLKRRRNADGESEDFPPEEQG